MQPYTGPQAYPLVAAIVDGEEHRVEYVVAWRDGTPITTSGPVQADHIGYGVTPAEALENIGDRRS